MTDASRAAHTSARLPLEPASADFPYYAGVPVMISRRGWLVVLAGVAAGFAALDVRAPVEDNIISGWLRVAAFVGLPLLALAYAAPRAWTAIFRRVGPRQVLQMLAFGLANIVISMAVGAVVKTFGTVSANGEIAGAGQLEGLHLAAFFAKIAPQLLGEELLTILPLLAIMRFCTARGISRNRAALIAWIASAVLFGLLHLPTYGWNLVQCVVVIGSARLVLSWAYVWSKNIWVSTGAHIFNDWTLIASTIFLAPLAGHA